MTNYHADMNRKLLEALGGVLAEAGNGDMMTKAVIVAEVITGDGKRAGWRLSTPDLAEWETIGMLRWAQLREEAKALAPDLVFYGDEYRASDEADEDGEDDD